MLPKKNDFFKFEMNIFVFEFWKKIDHTTKWVWKKFEMKKLYILFMRLRKNF
jgi:hypothetical protein